MRRLAREDGAGRGFTLIEMMIAVMLFSVVAAGLMTSVIVMGRAQAAAARLDVAQGGVRAALELITHDVEMTSAGARSGLLSVGTGTPTQLAAITVTNGTGGGSDRIDLLLIDPVARATVVASFGAGQNSIAVDNTAGFAVGDAIEVTDLTTATLLTVTAIGTLGGTPSLTIATPGNPLPRTYPAGSYVFRSRHVTYFVDTQLFGTLNPLLMMDPDGNGPLEAQPVAEGIEDVQVALGFDLDGDGAIASKGLTVGDDEWIFNVAGETAPASLSQLRGVRVTLLARTTAASVGMLGRRPAAEDHAGSNQTDGFTRRILKSEIAVRNFNL